MTQDPFAFAHAHRDEIVWMSQNTNQFPPPPAVAAALAETLETREYQLYAMPNGIPGLPELIKKDLELDTTPGWSVAVTHGALEALYALNRAWLKAGDEVIATDPSFLPIHNQIKLSGATPIELGIYEAPWKLSVEAARAAVTPATRMILLIDPLNPLGSAYSADEVKAFAELAQEKDVLLVHDITYRDFAYEPALAHTFAPDHTVYAYSFSKNAGLAGMRVGALVAPDAVFAKVKPHLIAGLGTNVVAQRAAKAALETKAEWLPGVLKTARHNQELIKAMVDGMDGVELTCYPSNSNTLCLDTSALGLDPDEVERVLLFDHKVFVRGGGYLSKRFGPQFVRVSFTVPTDGVKRFCDAFPKVVAQLTKK